MSIWLVYVVYSNARCKKKHKIRHYSSQDSTVINNKTVSAQTCEDNTTQLQVPIRHNCRFQYDTTAGSNTTQLQVPIRHNCRFQ